MKAFIKKWNHICIRSCLDLLYPPLCLQCQAQLPLSHHVFCESCLNQLEFSTPEEHCPGCFTPFENPERPFCLECLANPSPFQRLFSLFNPSETSQTFCYSLKTHSNSFLIQDAAAWMAYRYCALRMPFPDLICGYPASPVKKIFNGPSASERLAQEFAFFLKIPFASGLIRTNPTYDIFTLKNAELVEDRKVLLLKDTLTSDLFKAGEALQGGFPQKIWGLTMI